MHGQFGVGKRTILGYVVGIYNCILACSKAVKLAVAFVRDVPSQSVGSDSQTARIETLPYARADLHEMRHQRLLAFLDGQLLDEIVLFVVAQQVAVVRLYVVRINVDPERINAGEVLFGFGHCYFKCGQTALARRKIVLCYVVFNLGC